MQIVIIVALFLLATEDIIIPLCSPLFKKYNLIIVTTVCLTILLLVSWD